MHGKRVTARVGLRFSLSFGLFAGLTLCSPAAHAGLVNFCDKDQHLSPGQQDLLFSFAGLIKAELERSGVSSALLARSGLNLSRFDQRYSHAGISLKASENGPWSVRQLYYACDEKRPRIFDQGMAGFVLGADNPKHSFISVLLLPPDATQAMSQSAADKRLALASLGPTYSANAYAFSTRYQNCNQWLIELLALAWGGPFDAAGQNPREQAQRWLRLQNYRPTPIHAGPLADFAALIPWLHTDDHPEQDLRERRFQISMPTAIEAFVHARYPATQRLEFCRRGREVVIRRGWTPLPEDCSAEGDDEHVLLSQTRNLN
ncbi:MAG: DUF2145 domain-containing protein [Burkholderiaceae bacterium]|nr:DUF2145 domain-containing protein [Burkholderiaceae bacterium]